MARRVCPVMSLNLHTASWIIKVQVSNKGNLRSFNSVRGDGRVFNVLLTDEDGTQIQATMFNEAATKFYPEFEVGKVYYISKGSIKLANEKYKTVPNDYEITLNDKSIVLEVKGETFNPKVQYNFIKFDQLANYVNSRLLVDIVGVLQDVSTTLRIRRKSDNQSIPKRDIVLSDDSGKSVTVTLWTDLATAVGEELLAKVHVSPIVAIKSLRVSEFQGVSLSTVTRSTIVIDPDLPEAKDLKTWYEAEGKGASDSSIVAYTGSAGAVQARSMYSDRAFLSLFISNPSMGQDKPVPFSIYALICHIKPDQNMWYRACKTCNKKVTEAVGSGYWCDGCQKFDAEYILRYVVVLKVSDPTGEAWMTVFNEHAERIFGCSAHELNRIRTEEGEDKYIQKISDATWVPHLFRVSVTQHEYNGVKKQRIIVKDESPVDYVAEANYLLREIAIMTSS